MLVAKSRTADLHHGRSIPSQPQHKFAAQLASQEMQQE
jgi:hypothetical protein